MTPHESERLDGSMEYLEKNGFHEPVKVVARLRASNAALKAENEALKREVASLLSDIKEAYEAAWDAEKEFLGIQA